MADWSDFELLLKSFGGKQLNDDILLLEFEVDGPGSKKQEVYLIRETLEPGLDVVRASCAVAVADLVDVAQIFRSYGDLNIGSLQYVPSTTPLIALGMIMPLPIVDMSDPGSTMAVLHSLAEAARRVARRIGGIV